MTIAPLVNNHMDDFRADNLKTLNEANILNNLTRQYIKEHTL